MTKVELTREERIAFLTERDGPDCFLCNDAFKTVQDITFDHWIPRSKGGTWDLENLRLAHKRCNALKGDRMPNPDGTIPELIKKSTFRSKAVKRAARPDLCTACDNGRELGPQESCNECGVSAFPTRWPRWAKVPANICDHADFWCWACGGGVVDRKSAAQILIEGP